MLTWGSYNTIMWIVLQKYTVIADMLGFTPTSTETV